MQKTNAGQEIRLADIEADAGLHKGIFEKIHNQLSPAGMALSLKEYSSKYYGAVGMAWLQKVVANQSSIAMGIADAMQEFVNSAVLPDSTGQIIRVARRFALVAVAGELANQYGSIIKVHQDAMRSVYDKVAEAIGSSIGGLSTKIHAKVDSFGNSSIY